MCRLLSVIQYDYKGDDTKRMATIYSRIDSMMLRNWPKRMASKPNVLDSLIQLPFGVVVVGAGGRHTKNNYVPPPPPPQVTTEELFLDSLSGKIEGEIYFPSDDSTLQQMVDIFEVKMMKIGDPGSGSGKQSAWGQTTCFSPSPETSQPTSSQFSASSKWGNATVFFSTSFLSILLRRWH